MNKKEYMSKKENEHLFYEGIKDIELVLENCEIIKIPRKNIGEITIKDFEKSFRRIALNSISLCEIAKYIVIQIKNDNNDNQFSSTFGPAFTEPEEQNLFDRLSMNDITGIYINYLWDDECHHWYVDYDEESEDLGACNKLQTTKECFNDIWIAIGEKAQKNLDKYFPKNQEERDFEWRMYEVD